MLPPEPDFEFKGHTTHRDAAAWRRILKATRQALKEGAGREKKRGMTGAAAPWRRQLPRQGGPEDAAGSKVFC